MSAEAGIESEPYYPPKPYGSKIPGPYDAPGVGTADDVSRETSPDDAPELLEANELAESLTGFDEIAIEQWFKLPFSKLAGDELKLLRSLYFIHVRRAEGASDKAAWRTSMEIPLSALKDKFADADNGADPDDDETRGERDRAYAEFVMTSGVPYTMDEYNALTMAQKNAVYDIARKQRK